MSVVSVNAKQSSLKIDERWHRTYTSIYEVITNDVLDGPKTAVNATGIPNYGSPYQWGNDSDPWAFCQTAQVQLRQWDETRKLWVVTVEHSTISRTQQNSYRESPIDWRPIISGSFARFSKPAERDKDDEPITNSVQEPFVPAVEIDDSRDSLHITVNTPTINLVTRANSRNKVNSSTIWGLPARSVKLNQWAWSVKYYGLTAYIENQFEFEIKYDLWDFHLLDQGFRKLVDAAALAADDKYQTICDKWNQPRHQPTMLNGAGLILDLDTTPAGVFLEFRIYKEYDFTTLPVPNPLPGPFV